MQNSDRKSWKPLSGMSEAVRQGKGGIRLKILPRPYLYSPPPDL